MRKSRSDLKTCDTCTRLVTMNHFEKLNKNHFVSVVNKSNPKQPLSFKAVYKTILNNACEPCQKKVLKHHFDSLPEDHKSKVVSSIPVLALPNVVRFQSLSYIDMW